MTLNELKKAKEICSKCGEFTVSINGDKYIHSSNCFILWDDSNELIHTIVPTTELDLQFFSPMKIKSYPYEMINYIIGKFSGENKMVYQK